MATNIDAPSGLRYVGNLCGGPCSAQVWKCNIPSSDTDNWFIGDPVVISGALTDTTGMYPGVDLATAGDGNPISGVVMSFEPPTGYENYKYRLGSVTWKVNVCFDPFAIFEIQTDDDDTASWTYDDVWLNACLESAGAGSIYTGLSGWELDGSDAPDADSSNQVMLLGLADYPDNVTATAHSKWKVYLSHHQLSECTTAGDGVLGVG